MSYLHPDVTIPDNLNWLSSPLINKVWLVKERMPAHIIIPHTAVDVVRPRRDNMGWVQMAIGDVPALGFHTPNLRRVEKWCTDADGRGFDSRRLMLPMNAPYFCNPMWQKKAIEFEINDLRARQEMLEDQIRRLKQRLKRLDELATIQDVIE